MIIIKIIFLYFIKIAHTDDLPSTGTQLVIIIIINKKRMCFRTGCPGGSSSLAGVSSSVSASLRRSSSSCTV